MQNNDSQARHSAVLCNVAKNCRAAGHRNKAICADIALFDNTSQYCEYLRQTFMYSPISPAIGECWSLL